MSEWHRITDDDQTADTRTLTLMNMGRQEVFFLTERLDWQGNVLDREGDERLLPIMQISVEIQNTDPEHFDPDEIKKRAAPMIAKVIGEITNQDIDVDDIIENMEVSMSGSWQAVASGTPRLAPPPKKLH